MLQMVYPKNVTAFKTIYKVLGLVYGGFIFS